MTTYSHQFIDKTPINLPVGKVICVGRNYAEHAKELNNPVPKAPILFMKPATAICNLSEALKIPNELCHFETELSVLIGKKLTKADSKDVMDAITGFGLGLDLTLRDRQNQLKTNGQPWEIAKAFDGACPLSNFVSKNAITNPKTELHFSCEINDELRQDGHITDMLFPIEPLIAEMSQHFTLLPGDVILTGTPKGVGPLNHGDKLTLSLGKFFKIKTTVS